MRISVIGTGYVGLVTSVVFAKLGHTVYGIDIDEKKIKKLKKGIAPFYEPGLQKLLKENAAKKRLFFTNSYKETISKSEAVFICVGTPSKKNGDYNLSYIMDSVKSVAENLNDYTVIVIKSTVPPSTNTKVKKLIDGITKIPYDLASVPEFLKEGTAIADAFNPSRVVIGTDSKKAERKLLEIHKKIKAPRVLCSTKSAQLIKYAANAFLATKISYINSIAYLCEKTGADINDVSRGLGLDPRIGSKFLNAGLGYGGSCFPKDVSALIAFSKRLGFDFQFLKEVDDVNKKQVDLFINKIKNAFHNNLEDKTLSILGLAFKPETDDVREARSILIIKKLLNLGATIKAYDPIAMDNARNELSNVEFSKTSYEALKDSSALLLITEWEEFSKLDFKKVYSLMKEKNIFDGRNFLDYKKLKKIGFSYFGIGR